MPLPMSPPVVEFGLLLRGEPLSAVGADEQPRRPAPRRGPFGVVGQRGDAVQRRVDPEPVPTTATDDQQQQSSASTMRPHRRLRRGLRAFGGAGGRPAGGGRRRPVGDAAWRAAAGRCAGAVPLAGVAAVRWVASHRAGGRGRYCGSLRITCGGSGRRSWPARIGPRGRAAGRGSQMNVRPQSRQRG